MRCLINSVERLSKTTVRLVLTLPYDSPVASPGQFVRVDCSEGGLILPRPISICHASREFGTHKMALVVEDRGSATNWLTSQKSGKNIEISLPIGNGFDIQPDVRHLLVGGGIGVPPLYFAKQRADKDSDSILCFSSKNKIIMEHSFSRGIGKVFIATDDGSYGIKGRADEILRTHLSGSRQNYYGAILACGPKAMLAAVAKIAREFGIPCQVSLEEYMACGVGACKGCAVQLVTGIGTVCKDGPVFNIEEVVWDV